MARNDTCACCGASDFRRCACPWGKPFSAWPAHLLASIKRGFTHGSSPHPNS